MWPSYGINAPLPSGKKEDGGVNPKVNPGQKPLRQFPAKLFHYSDSSWDVVGAK